MHKFDGSEKRKTIPNIEQNQVIEFKKETMG